MPSPPRPEHADPDAAERRAAFAARVAAGNAALDAAFAALDAGGAPDWAALAGAPGVCVAPMPWARAAALVADGSLEALGQLGRHPLEIRRYRAFRRDVILTEYATAADCLLAAVWGLPTAPDARGRRVAARPPGFAASGAVVWRENDFPYNFEPGVRHYNLWAPRPLAAADVDAAVRANLGAGAKVVWFVNPPEIQSVPDLWHAHVLARDKPGAAESGE